MDPKYQRIQANPRFQELIKARTAFAWKLTVVMLAIYYGFILIIAFVPQWLGVPLSSAGVTTVGIPVGIFVIVAAFVITGIFVHRANGTYDEMTRQIIEEAR